jgi:hypothetical protein
LIARQFLVFYAYYYRKLKLHIDYKHKEQAIGVLSDVCPQLEVSLTYRLATRTTAHMWWLLAYIQFGTGTIHDNATLDG